MPEKVFGIRDIVPEKIFGIRDIVPNTKNSFFQMSSTLSLIPKKMSQKTAGIRDIVPNTEFCVRRHGHHRIVAAANAEEEKQNLLEFQHLEIISCPLIRLSFKIQAFVMFIIALSITVIALSIILSLRYPLP